MRKLLLSLMLLGLVGTSRMFASACVTNTLANYVSLGATGCTVNGILVNDFNFAVVSTSLGSPLTSSAITVTPSTVAACVTSPNPPNTYQLCFSATGNTSSTGFTVAATDFAKYEIDFNWDPLVTGAEDDMVANTPVFPGTATVTTSLCNGQAFGGALCPTTAGATNTLTVFNDGHPGDAITTATTLLSPADVEPGTTIGTRSLVDLEANGASSTITGFDTSLLTPEPGTFLLLAAGLLTLARISVIQAIAFRGPSRRS
jgi:hypothetical protein